jgi:hypothetical protein
VAAVAHVEAACAFVPLEHPEPKAVRALPLGRVEERRPRAAVLSVRVDVEEFERPVRERREADDTRRCLRDPNLPCVQHDILDPCALLVVRVQRRQVVETGE